MKKTVIFICTILCFCICISGIVISVKATQPHIRSANSYRDALDLIELYDIRNSLNKQEGYIREHRIVTISLSVVAVYFAYSIVAGAIDLVKSKEGRAEAKQRKREARKEKKIAKLKEKLNDMEQ